MKKNSLKVQQLTYGPSKTGKSLFSNLSFEYEGTPTLLLGVNGAGKTTLLRLLAGQLKPKVGKISTEGTVIYVPQMFIPINGFTCIEYASYTAWLNGQSKKIASKEAIKWLRFVGLEKEADQRCDRLSGGQKTRLALAASLNSRSDILLLDEPSASLDPLSRSMLTSLYRDIASQGIGLIVSTHDALDISTPFENAIVLDSGTVLFEGRTSEFLHGDLESPIARELSKAFLVRNTDVNNSLD